MLGDLKVLQLENVFSLVIDCQFRILGSHCQKPYVEMESGMTGGDWSAKRWQVDRSILSQLQFTAIVLEPLSLDHVRDDIQNDVVTKLPRILEFEYTCFYLHRLLITLACPFRFY